MAEVTGTVYDKEGNSHFILKGKWTEGMTLQPSDKSTPPKVIWKRNDLPPEASRQFEFTSFAITLNEIPPGLEKKMPPTDSRRRIDMVGASQPPFFCLKKCKSFPHSLQRLYEEGKVGEAQTEKERLEEKQRSARRLREAAGDEYLPLFFTKVFDQDIQQEVWVFNDLYWRTREKADWSKSPDVF